MASSSSSSSASSSASGSASSSARSSTSSSSSIVALHTSHQSDDPTKGRHCPAAQMAAAPIRDPCGNKTKLRNIRSSAITQVEA